MACLAQSASATESTRMGLVMTLSDKLTRDQVRDAFNRNLTYADLCGIDIRALQGFIAIECARHDRKLASKGELLMLMQPSCLKKHAPNISASTERPGIYEAFLRVDGRYWQGREAVSFNGDGFIGIAGNGRGHFIRRQLCCGMRQRTRAAQKRQKGVKGYRYPQNTKRRPQRPREPRMRRNLGRSEYGKRHLAGFKHPARLH